MKSRKIFTALIACLLLAGCGTNKEEEGFYVETFEKKSHNTSTVSSTASSPNVLSSTTQEIDVEEPETSVTTTSVQTYREPETIIPKSVNNTVEPITKVPNKETQTSTVTSRQMNDNSSMANSQSEETKVSSYKTERTYRNTVEPNPEVHYGIGDLPQSVLNTVKYWEEQYPGMTMAVGIYSLDGNAGYVYNPNIKINSACTIKAPYALYVLKTCESQGIDIFSETISYEERHQDTGTSDISLYGNYGDEYTISELIRLMLNVSDNTAYNMLLEKFPIVGMYDLIIPLGGQNDYNQWGTATIVQRKNEWVAIINYINSGSLYGSVLGNYLTGTAYSYLTDGMQGWHYYMQKSGWTDDQPDYPAANAVAVIDDNYLIVVMTEDYSTGIGHIDVVESIGGAVESFANSFGGNIF